MIPDTLFPTIAQVSITLAALSGVAGVIKPIGGEVRWMVDRPAAGLLRRTDENR